MEKQKKGTEEISQQNKVAKQSSWFWDLITFLWGKVLRPIATGIVYGSGCMLGTCLVRFFVMERLGIVKYKAFERPKGVEPFFEATPK